jgi:uncharacterized protein YigE (DUF2233 family)
MVARKSWRFVRIAVGNYWSFLKVHMFSQTITKPHSSEIFSQSQNNTWEIEGERMYAIAFDMDIESLKIHYGDPYNNAYSEIKKVLQKSGFTRQQGSVYFGNEDVK